MRRICSRGHPTLLWMAASVLLSGCNRHDSSPAKSAPDVFIIVMDAMSARFLTPYGDKTETSPNLDAFAREAVVFENAYSQTATTTPSTASLMTGALPTTHRLSPTGTLSNRFKTMPQILTEKGFDCHGFFGNPHAGAHALGLDRGFEKTCVQVYALDELQSNRPIEEVSAFRVVFPEDMNGQVFRILPTLPKTGQFAYVHYLQPHIPYVPPARFLDKYDPDKLGTCHCGGIDWKTLFANTRHDNEFGKATQPTIDHMKARYRANIRYVDEAFGKLVTELKKDGLYDNALIIVMSDHGDAFFEHHLFGHNNDLHDEMVRIPLMFKFPKHDSIKPRRVKKLASTIDVMPTVLDFLGIAPPPGQIEGNSLMQLIYGREAGGSRDEVLMSQFNFQAHALRVGDFKFIYRGPGLGQLYNLALDPGEKEDLILKEPARAAALSKRLEELVDLTTNTTKEAGAMSLRADPRMDAHLNALGYVGSADERRAATPTSAPSTAPAP